jgi:hypothetical protein
MINSIVIETLRSFSSDEIRAFGKFVRSPYFNESPVMTRLYEALRKYYPEFSNRNLTKEKLHRKLFPGRKYNDETIRKMFSDFEKLLEQFLSHSYLDESLFDKNIFLLDRLDNKRLDKLFNRKLKKLEEKYIGGEDICEEYFERNFSLATKKWNHIIGRGAAGQYDAHDTVLETHSARFNYFITEALINILKMSQDFVSIARFYSVDYSSTLGGKLLENFSIKDFTAEYKTLLPEYYSIVMIYYYNYIILTTPDADDSAYSSLKNLIFEHTGKFSLHERKIHMLFLENGCLAKIREGRNDFLRELHTIYKMMLSGRLYVYKDSHNMTTSRFIKVVQNAIDIKEYAWAENFIEEYSGELSEDAVTNVRNFSYAQLNFSRGDYDKAIEFSSQAKSLTFTQNFQSKILRLKSYYELKFMDEILYQLDSHRHTLQKDNISPLEAKKKFHGFMLFLNKLVKMYLSEDKSTGEINIIINELKKEENIYERQWLEEKFNLLNNSI